MINRRSLIAATTTLGASALAGCGFFSRPEFGFEEVAFAAAEPTGVGEFDEQPEAAYERGTPAWLYMATVGAGTDDVETATLGYEITIDGPGGSRWQTVTEQESWEDADADLILAVWRQIETTDAPEIGTYSVGITVTDEPTGEQVTQTVEMTLTTAQ